MKHFEELTKEELADLTPEQIDFYVKLKCAEEGVRFQDAPIEPEKVEVPKELFTTIYSVGNFNFLTNEDAMRVVEAIRSAGKNYVEVTRDWYSAWEQCYFKQHDHMPIIESKMIIPHQFYLQHAEKMVKYKKFFKEFEEAQKEYKKHLENRQKILDEILDKVDGARAFFHKIALCSARIREYTELASGDQEVGLKFFRKAYPEISEEIITKAMDLNKMMPESNDIG